MTAVVNVTDNGDGTLQAVLESIDGDPAGEISFTNTSESTSVSGTKTWDDSDDQDGVRPASITVRLFNDDNVQVAEQTVTADDNWTYTFDNLPKYDQGREITYTVQEDAVENYQTEYTDDGIVNTYKPDTTHVSVRKVWDDGNNRDETRPDSIEVKLIAEVDGESIDLNRDDMTVTLSDDNNWSYDWTDLPLNQNKGEKVTYTVEEVNVPDNYTVSVDGDQTTGYTITNTENVAAAVIRGTKTVDGLDDLSSVAGQFRFELLEDGRKIDTAKNGADGSFSFARIVYKTAGTHTYTVQEMNAGRTIDGISYSDESYEVTVNVTEDEDGILKAEVSGTADFVNEAVRTLHVNKIWNDDDNAAGQRPGSVTVELLKDGVTAETAVLSDENNWSYDFTGLDADASYTVKEDLDENSGYTATEQISADGSTVTLINTFNKTVDITAHKTLTGALLQNGEFTFRLVRNSDPDNYYDAVNDEEGNIYFNNIPYDASGYTVTEVKGSEAHVTYDTEAISYDADGNVVSAKTSFTNKELPTVLRVQKRSKAAPYDPLVGATYGLYQVDTTGEGNDVLIEAETSDENGYMYYGQIQEGVLYYFKEISAPAGHEVDPYPGEKFQIAYQDGKVVTLDENGNETTVGDITTQDSSAAFVQVNDTKTDLSTIEADAGQVKYENSLDNGIEAVAVATEGVLPEGTVLEVERTELSDTAAENLEKQIGEVTDVVFYDVTFLNNGEEVEPEAGSVTVTIQSDSGEDLNGTDAEDLKIVHLLDDEATAVAPVAGTIESDGEKLLGTSLTADSFSIFGVVEPQDDSAFGENYLLTASGVSDKVSKVSISKLDTAGKYIIGAHLQIKEQNTGKVVADWTTTDGAKAFNRWFDDAQTEPLNVNTVYVLHEVSAPEGYKLADDIAFELNQYDSSVTIWKYDDNGSLVEDTKSMEEWANDASLIMTDTPIKVETDKEYKQKVISHETVLYQAVNTGVNNNTMLYMVLIVVAVAAAVGIGIARKKSSKEE